MMDVFYHFSVFCCSCFLNILILLYPFNNMFAFTLQSLHRLILMRFLLISVFFTPILSLSISHVRFLLILKIKYFLTFFSLQLILYRKYSRNFYFEFWRLSFDSLHNLWSCKKQYNRTKLLTPALQLRAAERLALQLFYFWSPLCSSLQLICSVIHNHINVCSVFVGLWESEHCSTLKHILKYKVSFIKVPVSFSLLSHKAESFITRFEHRLLADVSSYRLSPANSQF